MCGEGVRWVANIPDDGLGPVLTEGSCSWYNTALKYCQNKHKITAVTVGDVRP